MVRLAMCAKERQNSPVAALATRSTTTKGKKMGYTNQKDEKSK